MQKKNLITHYFKIIRKNLDVNVYNYDNFILLSDFDRNFCDATMNDFS